MSKGRNKRKERTEQLREAIGRRAIAEQADNAIEQHNFDKLVKSGTIVKIWTCEAQ